MLRRRELILAGALVLIAGCGTTVHAPTSSDSQNLSLPGAGAPAAGMNSGQSLTSGESGPAGQSGPGTSATAVSATPGGVTAGAGATASGPIEIGFEFLDNSDGVYQALSGSTSSTGAQPREQIAALVKYINSHGGMAGRQVRAVVHATLYSDALYSPDAAAQAACVDFSEDHHVFAAVITTTWPNLVDCLARHRVITVGNDYILDRKYFQEYANLYFAPGAMDLDRGAEAMATRLHTAGWFAGGKVGILYDESAPYTRAKDSLLSRLRALGVHVDQQYGIVSPAGDLSGASAAAQNAVLQFRSAGIDRVLSVDRGGGLFYLFSTSAESQQYRPKYGLNTNNLLSSQQAIAPAAQWANVTAVSWNPYDVSPTQFDIPNKQRALCQKILRAVGADQGAVSQCDSALFTAHVLDIARGVTLTGFARVAARLGRSYQSSYTFGTLIQSGRNDGAAGVRLATVDPQCTCLHWASGVSQSD